MEFTGFPYLTAILLSCVAGLLVILFVPGENRWAVKWVSAVFSGLTLALSVAVFLLYDTARGGLQFVERAAWVPSFGIQYLNAVDGFSLPMVLLTGIVFFTGVLTMWELENRVKEFYAFYFLLVTGVFGLFMTLDLFFIFIWYDVSLFPMYPLIAIWGSTRKEYGAMKLTLYLLAGSALILPAIIFLHVQAGGATYDITALMRPGTFSAADQKLAFPLLYIGFGILAAVWPFHTWSPVGHVAAPTAVSMVHAGVLMKIGAFGVLRVGMFLCPEGWQFWAPLMATVAVIGIVYGALVALSQTDLKFVVGYSSVSHMGIVGLGLSTLTVDGLNGAVFQMFAHDGPVLLGHRLHLRTHPHQDDPGAGRVEPHHAGRLGLLHSGGPDRGRRALSRQLLGRVDGVHCGVQGLPGRRRLRRGGAGAQRAFHAAGRATGVLRAGERKVHPPRRRLLRPGGPAHDPGGGDRAFRAFAFDSV